MRENKRRERRVMTERENMRSEREKDIDLDIDRERETWFDGKREREGERDIYYIYRSR